ncbi:phosphotransferase [Tardiphaga sp.]|uniref:phosphotransferase n=1 Tax=Tardiphaga sp. TaxID=1926292 RepID=UPI00262672FC|nr:phosphotransferase [Tardiphaga sp.]MDB5620857.1 homoserine kinase [Tardiphaga sp.]
MTNDSAPPSIALPSGLAAAYVVMPEAEAVELARNAFGIEGRATRFATEKDDTFRITPASGARFILKVANPVEDVPEIDLQLRILQHLAATAPDLPVPRVVDNARGEHLFAYQDRAGQPRQVRMMSYLEGKPLSEVPSTLVGRQEIGRLLARLRLALADFSHPADSRVLPWDIKHLLSLQSLLGGITEPARRRQVEAGLARFASIEGRLAGSRMQVLHNDFSSSNIVVDPLLPGFVSGVIDFGDAVRTSIAIDVSTALLSQLPRQGGDDFFDHGRDLLGGYLGVADLTAEELSLIPHLVMGRIVARVLLSISLANSVPENSTYLLRNTEQSWSQLNWFLNRSMDEVSGQFADHAV